MDTNIFTGDGSDTTFTLSTAPSTENNLMVFIDGVFQAQNVYSVSGTTLTFATAPANGRVITVYHSTTTVGGSNNTLNTMTGDGSNTTLTLSTAPVHENNVSVYFDGVYQSKSNYSVSGTTLTFSTAPPTGVLVEAVTATNTDISTATQLSDADGDTKVQVEESSDEDKIRFDTAGSERVIITNAGKVGISTSDPSQLLTVQSATFPVVEIANYSDSNPTDGAALDLIEKQPSFASATNTFGQTGVYGFRLKLNGSDNTLRIKSGSQTTVTDRVVLDRDTNNIGLGTTSLTKDTGYATLSLSDTTGGQVVFKDDGTTMAGINGNSTRLSLTAVGSRNIIFNTNGSERLRVDSTGNLFLGTTSGLGKFNMDFSSVFGKVFKYTGSTSTIFPIVFDYGSSTAGSISITSSATSYNTSSDYRLKENVNYEFDALDRLKQLKPARFNFITDAAKTVDGFLAHEVSDIVPEAITGEKDGEQMQGIDQSKLVPLLTKAIQELLAKVEELEGKISE